MPPQTILKAFLLLFVMGFGRCCPRSRRRTDRRTNLGKQGPQHLGGRAFVGACAVKEGILLAATDD